MHILMYHSYILHSVWLISFSKINPHFLLSNSKSLYSIWKLLRSFPKCTSNSTSVLPRQITDIGEYLVCLLVLFKLICSVTQTPTKSKSFHWLLKHEVGNFSCALVNLMMEFTTGILMTWGISHFLSGYLLLFYFNSCVEILLLRTALNHAFNEMIMGSVSLHLRFSR